jgi:hypothetical protein
LRGKHRRRVVPGLLFFFCCLQRNTGKYRESGICLSRDRIAYDGLSNGDDIAGVYIGHALPVVQQQLLNAGIRLAKIIDENF